MSEFAPEPAAAPESPPAAEPAAASPDTLATGLGAGEVAPVEPTPVEPALAAPAAPEFNPQEFEAALEYALGQNAELAARLEQLTAGQTSASPAAGAPALPSFVDEFGQFDPEAFARFQMARDQALLGVLDERFQQVSAPLAAQQEAALVAEGEQRLTDILVDNINRHGEFASDPEADRQARAMVRTLADQLFPEVAERFGNTPKAAEVAMSRAADQVRGLLGSVAGAGAAQAANRLATLAGAATSAGNGATGGVEGLPDFKSPSDVTSFYAAKAREAAAAGQ